MQRIPLIMSFQLPTYFYCWNCGSQIIGLKALLITQVSQSYKLVGIPSSPSHKAVVLLWHQHNTMGKSADSVVTLPVSVPFVHHSLFVWSLASCLTFSVSFSVTISIRLQVLLEKLQDIFLILIF